MPWLTQKNSMWMTSGHELQQIPIKLTRIRKIFPKLKTNSYKTDKNPKDLPKLESICRHQYLSIVTFTAITAEAVPAVIHKIFEQLHWSHVYSDVSLMTAGTVVRVCTENTGRLQIVYHSYAYTHARTHACTHARTHTRTHTHTHAHTYIHV